MLNNFHKLLEPAYIRAGQLQVLIRLCFALVVSEKASIPHACKRR